MPDPFVLTTETPFRNIAGDYPWDGTGQPIPQDDPQTPAPSPLLGAWQCPGCGTIYNMLVNSCTCQRRNMVGSASTTTQTFSVHGGLTCEDVGCPCVQDGGE